LFLLQSDRLFFIFKLDGVEVHDQARILFGLLLDVGLDAFFILDRVAFMLGNRAFHVPQLPIQLFDHLRITFFVVTQVSLL